MHKKETKQINWKSLISAIFIISILSITLLFLFKNHSLNEIRILLLSLKTKWALVAVGCVFLSYISEMMCFYEITKKIYGKASMRTSFRVTMAGVYFNSITPFAGGGQPFQVCYLMKDGIPMGSCANIVMLKSIIFQVVVFISSIFSFAINANSLNHLVQKFTLFFVIGASINLVVIFFFVLLLVNRNAAKKLVDLVFKLLGWCHILRKPEKYNKQKEAELECFSNGSRVMFKDLGAIAKISFYQFLNLFFIYVIPWFLLVSLEGTYGSFMDILTSQAVLKQITAYVPSPGAAGGAEGISYFFFKNFFVKSPIVSVILIWRILTYYLNVVFGGLCLTFIKNKDVKQKPKCIHPGKAA